jgi:hypothetical protein
MLIWKFSTPLCFPPPLLLFLVVFPYNFYYIYIASSPCILICVLSRYKQKN